jgi:glycosyltransferase involved in cell wall biosynthesis
MSVSVIIPTYNGAKKIGGIIQALQKQTCPPFEVIVVIDGSTDNTRAVLHSLQQELKSLKIIEQENKGRAAVRNTGAKNATGDLLIFFDDDMLPLENCIAGHLAHHQKHEGSILTGGLDEPVNKRSADILKFKSHLSKKWNSELQADEEGKLFKQNVFIAAANFSISKDLFEKLGGFDERLKDAEDFDFAVRASNAGIPLYFNKQVFAWHNDTISCASYIKRQRQYAIAHKNLVSLNPWMAEQEYIKPVQKPIGWKKVIFKIFASAFWIKAIDHGKLKFLPQQLRYKIYDLVITSNGVYYTDKATLK